MILNLTQHVATIDQAEAGVVEPSNKQEVIKLITFNSLEDATPNNMVNRAVALAEIVKKHSYTKAMVGGAPFFASTLERVLLSYGIVPLYAFSVRKSVETQGENGEVKKTLVFKHEGFIESAQRSVRNNFL